MEINELDNLVDEVNLLTKALDETSVIIRQIEDILAKENKFKLEFKYHADVIEGIFISWKRIICHKKKKCRLYVQWVERNIERPIAELPVELRLEVIKYLFPFLEAFKEFVKVRAAEVEDAVAKMKSELECY